MELSTDLSIYIYIYIYTGWLEDEEASINDKAYRTASIHLAARAGNYPGMPIRMACPRLCTVVPVPPPPDVHY